MGNFISGREPDNATKAITAEGLWEKLAVGAPRHYLVVSAYRVHWREGGDQLVDPGAWFGREQWDSIVHIEPLYAVREAQR